MPANTRWYVYDTFETVVPAGEEFVFPIGLSDVGVFLRGGQIVVRKDRVRRSSSLTVQDPFTMVVALDWNVWGFVDCRDKRKEVCIWMME